VLRVLMLGLTIAAPIVLLLAAGGGYLLAGRALQPVASITALAGSVSAADLHTRLDLNLPDDELGRLARTFDGMLGRIEDAFERQRRFTGDAAHELRTPLSFIRSQVDLALARERSPDEYREALQAIDGDLGRLTGLVGTLLMLARSDSGHVPLERAPLDLTATVGLIIEQYRPLADEAGITLVDESGSAELIGDEDLIIQVLVNLLDNAIAHTPADGRITVGCRTDGDWAHLCVADTGHGISIEHQSLVFDRFYRVDEGRSRHIGGAGLGLSICRAIVEAHGGSIALSSRPGAGTTVEIRLPTQPPSK
jgi:heavy metal sensor kinase